MIAERRSPELEMEKPDRQSARSSFQKLNPKAIQISNYQLVTGD
ncbi:MAG: hypothetical protein AAGA60_24020 [Cyanobacteria bacterium P01_E01_bin.42]